MSVNTIFVLGTRPEIIKLSPVIRSYQESNDPFAIVHTGQHYSDNLDSVFFEQLELPEPNYNLGVGSHSQGVQTGKMLIQLEQILKEKSPETVLVQGDTNSVLAGAIATSKLNMNLGHVEAGLRSFDREMPEEINRIVTDHIADYLFAPTEKSSELLQEEGVSDDRIIITGNTIVDAVQQSRELAAVKSSILSDLGLDDERFGLITAHRAENVDNKERLRNIFDGLQQVIEEFDFEFIYPIHPRAAERIEAWNIETPTKVRIIEPLGYLDFLRMENMASIILTDSGGVQEEACILGTPCVTMRENTERPETIKVGANRLAGTEPEDILEAAKLMIELEGDWKNPFGDGNAGSRIHNILTG